jgi:hypothetical protein
MASLILNADCSFYLKTTATLLFSNFYQPISESLLGVDCSNATDAINTTAAALFHTTGTL